MAQQEAVLKKQVGDARHTLLLALPRRVPRAKQSSLTRPLPSQPLSEDEQSQVFASKVLLLVALSVILLLLFA